VVLAAGQRRAPSSDRQAAFIDVLGAVASALDASRVRYGLFGGVASAAYGRPRWTEDIDVFVRPQDADAVLQVLEPEGFAVERTNPAWIFKAFRDQIQVDVIFKTRGTIYFDERMVERCRRVRFEGVEVSAIAPEDLVVIKAVVHDEESPRHWHDALGILAVNELDWDYFLDRARVSPNRVLSLLHYALSIDVTVPQPVVRRLMDVVVGSWG
jgi:predicted nucleotidyltransferase